jgi:hypothetical protein
MGSRSEGALSSSEDLAPTRSSVMKVAGCLIGLVRTSEEFDALEALVAPDARAFL